MHVPAAIGRYPVTGVIGTGAFSAVYRAIDERLGSEVAIKLLGDHHSLDPDIRDRFIAEARLLRRVSSPHVVRLYDLDETDRHQPFHVLELVPGGNLATHRRLAIGRGLPVTPADAVFVVTAVSDALTALHAERIVHRDLTPSNLLLRHGSADSSLTTSAGLIATGEQLVLADLGLSKDLAVSSGLTAAGGTEGFAAPEQRETGRVDERTDVFAAAALLTWFLLGHPPGDDDPAELSAAGWPAPLAAALTVGLAADPADRPASIRAWRDSTIAVLEPPRPASPVHGSAADRPRTRRGLLLGAVAVAVLAGGVGFGAAAVLDNDGGGGPHATMTELDDGRVRFERSTGDVTAAIEGPSELVVGETATLLARVDPATSWTWAGGGGLVADDRDLAVKPTRPGRLHIDLVVSVPGGGSLVVDAEFTVVAAPPG